MARLFKLVALLCVLAAVSAKPIDEDLIEFFENEDLIELAEKKDQTVILGNRQEGDRLIHTKKLEFNNKHVTEFTQAYGFGSNNKITCVKILDQLQTGNNAKFEITKGGVGEKSVSIKLKTTTGRISYILEIYAH